MPPTTGLQSFPARPSGAPETLVLTRRDIAALMRPPDYLAAVEAGFRASAEGNAHAPAPMHLPGQAGAFHAKGASLAGGRTFVALKLNGNFPHNPARTGLPTIQGMIALADGENGRLLALMDSIEITLRRTAAASALAARYLARPGAQSIAICGCGAQGRAQLEALLEVLPLRRAFAWDLVPEKAQSFAREMKAALSLDVREVATHREACAASDVIVTCTSAKSAFLTEADVRPGTFIAAVGADSPDKSEIAPDLMAASKVVVDALEQCAVMGELHHAIAAGRMTASDVHAELAELVAQRKSGRTRVDEVTIFDSTGTAIQDVASAVKVYERAVERGVGLAVALGAL
jgi:ornithine cyclodeaminase/alanine dehydrogenase-like protein (mu-crystallin family)